MNFAPLPT
jgi:uncharacterized protein YgiM (DUF1202 family)